MQQSTLDNAIRIKAIGAGYLDSTGLFSATRQLVVDDLSLTLAQGDIVGFLGENASGKSTLIRAIVDPEARWSGDVFCNGMSLHPWQVAYVPQVPATTLSPWLSVEREIALPVRVRSQKRKEYAQAVADTVKEYGISVPLDRRVGQLSGGQRVKVAVLRALTIPDIRLAVFDEPFENLDLVSRRLVAASIKKLASHGIPVIVTSHREADLDMLSARRLLLIGKPVRALREIAATEFIQDRQAIDLDTKPEWEGVTPTARATSQDRIGGILSVLGIVVGISVWSVAAALIHNARLLPPPWHVAIEMYRFLIQPDSILNVAATILRAFGWWTLANLAAIPFGILLGYSTRVYRFASPWLSLGRCLPIFALVGVARGLFAGQEWLQVGFLIWLTLFLVSLQAISAVAALAPRARLQTARLLGASHFFRLTRIMLPESLSGILGAIEITLPLSVIVTLVVESFTFPTYGLGLDIYNNMDKADLSRLFAGILLPGIIAAITTMGIRVIAKTLHVAE